MGAGIGLGGILGSNLASGLTNKVVGPNAGGYSDTASILGGLLGAGGLAYLAHKPFEESNRLRDLKRLKEMQDLAKEIKV